MAIDLGIYGPNSKEGQKSLSIMSNTQGDMLARMIKQEVATFDGTQHANFESIIRKYPHLSPDVVVGLIKAGANADTPGIDSVASTDGIAQVMRNATYTQKLPSMYAKDKSFLTKVRDLPYAAFKGTTRIGFAALRSPYDYITTAARDVFAMTQGEKGAGTQLAKDLNPANIFVSKTSTLGQVVRDVFDGTPGVSTGSGFFVSPESRVGKQQAKAMQSMGLVNGQSFTIGRGSMATIGADPNSTAYKLASGTIDAVLNIVADPSTYLGPGALAKVGLVGKARGGKELAGVRKTAQLEAEADFAANVQKLKKDADLTPEEQQLVKQALGVKGTIKRAVVNRLSIAEKNAAEAELHINAAEALATGKKAGLVVDAVDPKNVAKATGLDDPTLIKYVEDLIIGGKQDEIVDTLSSLSATSKNHGDAFPGAFMVDSLPEVGKPVPAAIGTDEFFVSLVKEGDLNIVDLAQDYTKLTAKEAELELIRRAKLSDEIKFILSNPGIDKATRSALSEIDDEAFFGSLAFEGPVQNLSDLIARVGITAGKKNKNAVSILTNLIEDIWKADGFSNVRAISSGAVTKRARPQLSGGIAITAKGVVAAKGIEISKTLADSKLTGLLSVPKSLPEAQVAYDKAIAEYDSALAAKDGLDATLKEIEALRKYTEMDPELVQAVVNNPAYAPFKQLLDLELEIGSATASKEFLRAEAGLVADGMGGPAAEDLVKVNKWLLGKRFAVVADVVAKETSASKISRLFNNKMDLEVAGELAKATTPDEVLKVLRKHLASPVSDPQLARSLSLQARELATTTPIIKTVLRPEGRAIQAIEKMEQALSRIYIRSAILPLDDLDRLGNGLREWMQSAEVPTQIIDDTIDKLVSAGASTERNIYTTRSAIISEGLQRGHEAIVNKYAPGNTELLEFLQKELRIGGKQQAIIKTYANTLLANGSETFVALADGTKIPTNGAVYVHQFLDDVVRLPSTKPIVAAIKKAERTGKLTGKTAAMQILTTELGEHWRTAQLAFRVSYVLRNIGEMQVRQYLSGHETLLNHPLSYIAMMAANPKGNAFQKWLTHIEKYGNDIMDNSFKDPTAAKLYTEAMDEYLEFMQRNISYGDPRSADPVVRVLGKIYQVVTSTHPNFYDGYSNMLSRFYIDDMMQLVAKANTEPLQRQLVQDLVANKPVMINGVERKNVLQEIHAGAKADKSGDVSDFDKIFLKDIEKGFSYDNLNIDGVWGWLFNVESTASYQTALNSLMGTGQKGAYIRELLSKGIVEVPMGNNTFKTVRMPRYKNSASIEDGNLSMKAFKKDLEEAFPVEEMPGAQTIWADTKTWTKENQSILRQGIDTFFMLSSKIENLVNFGPEYRMSYWDHIGRYAPAMNLDDLQKAYKVAEKTLAPIRTRTKAGKYIAVGKSHQTLKILQKEIVKRKKNPNIDSSMTLSDAHATASRMAGESTKELFYDASRTLDATNKARLIFPFLQAHINTIKSWGKLTAQNPIQVYKFGKAFNALTQPGTSAIYDLTNTQYDENDGFFYKDEFNTTRFRYPLLGNMLGAFAGKSIDSTQAVQLTAPVESLNLAFGSTNPLMPGVGPVAQGAFLATGKSNAFGGGWQFARDWVFPFGPPKDVTDIVVPAWLKKTIFLGLNDQTMVEKGVKGWAGYLASTGKYGDNPLADDGTREAMFNEATGLSRWVAAGTAIFQSILPATPSQEILNRIKTDEGKYQFVVNTILYNAWKDTLSNNAGDYDKSVLEFADKFGDENLLVILSGSTKSVTGTQDAWSFLNKNPDVAQKYATADADIIPYLFPGGEAAMAYYNWQRSTGRRTALTREDISNAAENLIYGLEKSRITNQQIAEGHSDIWYTRQIIELNKRYRGAPVSDVSTGRAQARADNVGLALQDKAFQMSPIYDEAVEFYTAYDAARKNLQDNRVSVDPDLGSTFWANARYREQLTQLGTKLMLRNPSFSHLYYSVFAPLLKAQG